MAGDREFDLEFRVVWPNGELRDIEAHGLVQRDAQGVATRMVGVNKDITQRKQADARIAYLNRIYAVLSGINTLIVRVQHRDQLFGEACRIALEAGGFRMAMIFIVDRSAIKIVPVASAGKDAGLMTAIKEILSLSGDVETSMVARAIRKKKTVVPNDTLGDSQVLLGKQYVEFGVRSEDVDCRRTPTLPVTVCCALAVEIGLKALLVDWDMERPGLPCASDGYRSDGSGLARRSRQGRAPYIQGVALPV